MTAINTHRFGLCALCIITCLVSVCSIYDNQQHPSIGSPFAQCMTANNSHKIDRRVHYNARQHTSSVDMVSSIRQPKYLVGLEYAMHDSQILPWKWSLSSLCMTINNSYGSRLLLSYVWQPQTLMGLMFACPVYDRRQLKHLLWTKNVYVWLSSRSTCINLYFYLTMQANKYIHVHVYDSWIS